MELTRAADYGVRVMVHLATRPHGDRVKTAELARETDVSQVFLSKVIQRLSRSGLIQVARGKEGGVRLIRPAQEVTLLDVVEAMEGPIRLNLCLASGHLCNRQDWCAPHFVWAEAQKAMTDVLRRASMAELARESLQRKAMLKAPGTLHG
jgi:Rrf2 family protein